MNKFSVLKSDERSMETANGGVVYGPVWLSKGERFRPTGAYIFLETRTKELQLQLKSLKDKHKELMIVIKNRERRMQNRMDSNDTGDDRQGSSTENTDKDEEKVSDFSKVEDKSLLSMSKKERKELKQVK